MRKLLQRRRIPRNVGGFRSNATGRPRAFPFASRKSVTNILRFAIGPAAAEGHENDPVTVEDRPVPATVFADEGAATIFLRQTVALLIELVVDLGVNCLDEIASACDPVWP